MDDVPLPELLRPRSLHDYVGQTHLVHPSHGLLSGFLRLGYLPSMVLAGPPGSGKTTLAAILCDCAGCVFVELLATDTTVAQLRELLQTIRAENARRHATTAPPGSAERNALRVAVFVDDLHRLLKTHQDFLLPFLECGDFVFIGATSVDPVRRLRCALLSRCHLFRLTPLSDDDALQVLRRAVLRENIRRKSRRKVCILNYSDSALHRIASFAAGDMRTAIGCVELLSTGNHQTAVAHADGVLVTDAAIEVALASLTRMRLGLADAASLPLVHVLLEHVSGTSMPRAGVIGSERPPGVHLLDGHVVRIRLPLVLLALLQMECVSQQPPGYGADRSWGARMDLSDDSDEDISPITASEEISMPRFRLFAAIYTAVELVEKGESPLLLLRYLLLYTCYFTRSDRNELVVVVAAALAVQRASVDPLHVLNDCLEYLSRKASPAETSLAKLVAETKRFLSARKPTADAHWDLSGLDIVYDPELEKQLLEMPQKVRKKGANRNTDCLFRVHHVDRTDLTGYCGLDDTLL